MSPLRPARPEEAAAVDAFLAPLSDTSMFLRSNIRAHGVCGGTHDHATTIWLDLDGAVIVGVIGVTTRGMVQVQMPGRQSMERAVQALRGMVISGVTGEASQVRAFRTAAGLDGAPTTLEEDERLYVLDFAALVVPPGSGAVRPPGPADAPLLEAWRAAYHLEVLGTPPEVAAEWARREVAGQIEAQTCRLIESEGVPMGMTALNAVLPEAVQIGGVYTPPEHRSQGFARRALALHLQELRQTGVRRAVLFASSPAACRAYEAVGFQHIGSYALVLFAGPAAIGAGA
jgi:GNAT superfamily N-acetyltransferase